MACFVFSYPETIGVSKIMIWCLAFEKAISAGNLNSSRIYLNAAVWPTFLGSSSTTRHSPKDEQRQEVILASIKRFQDNAIDGLTFLRLVGNKLDMELDEEPIEPIVVPIEEMEIED